MSLPDGAGRRHPLRAHLMRFGPLALVVVLIIVAFDSGLAHHLSLQELQDRRAELEAMVRAHPWLTLAAYVGLYAIVVGLSLPVALVMTLSGGLLFGPWIGGAAADLGCSLGAAIIFVVCRTAAGDVLKHRAGATVARITAGVRRNAFSYVLMLRLIPVTPLWLANLALGLVGMPFMTFFSATLIGIAPVSFVYAGLGSGLNTLFAKGIRPDLHLILRPEIFLPLIGLALLALIPVLVHQRRGRAKA